MDFTAQITQFYPDIQRTPALESWIKNLIDTAHNATQTINALNTQLSAKEAHFNAELSAKEAKIQLLTFELATLKRIRFSATSEALNLPNQQQQCLFEEDTQSDFAEVEATLEKLAPTPTATAPKKPRPKPTGRQALPDHLPRIEHRHEIASCQCGECGKDLVVIGEDVSEQLDVEPARFFVQRHIRPQYACRACDAVTAAPTAAAVIDGGMATSNLLAWIATQKFLDHLPLYRIEQICARNDVPLARSTMAEWVGRIGEALTPLATRLTELLKQRAVLHADETPVQQLDPGKGKTKRAYLWAYRSSTHDPGAPIVVFDYQPCRSGKHADAFLKNWQGHLMVDDYSGYKCLFKQGITELACLAHARRKFFDLHAVNQHPTAAKALQYIAALYAIEREAKDMSCQARAEHRLKHAVPLWNSFHPWLLQEHKNAAPNSALARAINYSLKRWPALIHYASSGDLPIDNNPIENAIRPIAIGKKNWLFAGSERAGNRAAAIQSLFATAKLNDIDPFQWLVDTIEKLPTTLNSQIDQLLPLRSVRND